LLHWLVISYFFLLLKYPKTSSEGELPKGQRDSRLTNND
jgi:hypothetical protein